MSFSLTSENKHIFVLVEKEEKQIASITYELLQTGRELSNTLNGKLCAVVLGHEVGDIAQEVAYFSDQVYLINNILLEAFQVDLYVYALQELCRKTNPNIFLIGHTLDNLNLAPRLACRMGVQLITDCIRLEIEPETGGLLCTKPVYGGRFLAVFKIGEEPQMVTVRPKVMKAIGRSDNKGEVVNFELFIDKSLAKTELIQSVPGEEVSLDKADAIVAGGRGIKTVEGITQLQELIKVLRRYFERVELGASRPLVDCGLLPRSRQIGQTGEKVSPQLYIAVGISGASQHLSGILGSSKLVAINKDDQALIFEYADYGVIARWEDVLPSFIKKLEELL